MYTPHGLKIFLAKAYMCALLARIEHGGGDSGEVLRIVEDIMTFPSFIAFIITIIVFLLRLSFVQIFIFIFTIVTIAQLVVFLGLFNKNFIVFVRIYRRYHLLFIFLTLLLGFVTVGSKGVLIWFIVRFCNGIIYLTIDCFLQIFFRLRSPETSFFKAYRILATQYKINTDTKVSEEELEPSNWERIYYVCDQMYRENYKRY